MITIDNILETNRMITENKLDVRTITMGISLRDCAHPNIDQFCRNVYDKITKSAKDSGGQEADLHPVQHAADCHRGLWQAG